jgi:hypothetical protein
MRPRAADSKARVRRLRSLVIASAQSGYALSQYAVATRVPPRAESSAPGPTWPVGPDTSARVSIGWPTTYGWPLAGHWVGGLRDSLAALVPVHPAEIEQPYEGTVLIEVTLDQTRHEVGIDYFDRARLLARTTRGEIAWRWPRALTTSATSVPTSWPATTSIDASRS